MFYTRCDDLHQFYRVGESTMRIKKNCKEECDTLGNKFNKITLTFVKQFKEKERHFKGLPRTVK